MRWELRWLLWLFTVAASVATLARAGEVTYDGRSLIIDGQRKMLFSGSIHYPRSIPQMWPSLIRKAKEGGLDVIQTYVFWNLHEPQPGQYDFRERLDLVGFLKEVHAQGLYACLRIGPFIEAEWTYGGFPFWLHDVPGIVFRTNNEPFKFYMQNFTSMIVNLMKSESLFASQGGPIILSQIENEYQNIQAAFQEQARSYVLWAADMAVGLGTGVPWVMCKQSDAPDPVINTCNGMRCGETFQGPNSPNKPALWTEDWTSFYQVYGKGPYIRSAEDIAFHAALFIAKMNGSYVNYYMYHGGTNFGRTSSAYVITGYYDQAPLDEYGLERQPKYGHLQELHSAVKTCSTPLMYGDKTTSSIGQLQEAYVFEEETGSCVAFLINNSTNNATVEFRNVSIQLLPKSITILKDCREPIFNTAKVNVGANTRTTTVHRTFDSIDSWQEFTEEVPTFSGTSLRSESLLEHMNTTKDVSDYLWYTFSFQPNASCTGSVLHVKSRAHVAHAFVNNAYLGKEYYPSESCPLNVLPRTAHGNHDVKEFVMDNPISLENEMNISILSVMVGLQDSGAFLESKVAGLTEVAIQCSQEDSYNFTDYSWGYQVGLLGEKLRIYDQKTLDNVVWTDGTSSNKPLTWYKTVFDAPEGNEPLALNLSSMGKGEVWVNGESIGRYWVSFRMVNGNPSQTLYHVPRLFVKSSENLLVIMEEEGGGNPLQVSLLGISRTMAYSNNNLSHFHSIM